MAKIFSVGVGPGKLELVTWHAREILEKADVVMGFNRIIHRIKPLIEGKVIYASGPNKEKQLIQKAYEIAQSGKNVAVVSSGDSGIYGMAVLLQSVLPENSPIEFEIVPGLPEFLCASALIGTPLTDDFSVLSLSTKLNPPETILFRARLIAQADLTVALYYPVEETSKNVLSQILDVFAEHRPPDTLVAMVTKPFRSEQETTISTLASFFGVNVSEFCTIFICSEDCRVVDNRIVGKRAYII